MTGVLADLKVLDLSWGIAGPMAGMLLADHGAQVTKIEPPGGDPFRTLTGAGCWHRGKRSAVLDLPAERDVLLALVDDADVVLESFSPGTTGASASTTTRCTRATRASCTARSPRTAATRARAPAWLRRARRRAHRHAVGAARLARRRDRTHGGQ